MIIRTADINDLKDIAAVEAECFPKAEAATAEDFADRLKYYANHFLLMYDGEKLAAFIDGFVTDEPNLTDEMYARANMHNENGAWQMIFGVNTVPEYRRQGLAGRLISETVKIAKKEGRHGLMLTCKDELVPYYTKFGCINKGITDKSVHGNVKWNQMRLSFGEL